MDTDDKVRNTHENVIVFTFVDNNILPFISIKHQLTKNPLDWTGNSGQNYFICYVKEKINQCVR